MLLEYHVEAAIAGLHAAASRAEDTRWGEIASLYDTLMRIRPSPVVALNRAMAIAQIEGPERGLQAIREIADAGPLSRPSLLPGRARRARAAQRTKAGGTRMLAFSPQGRAQPGGAMLSRTSRFRVREVK